MAKRISVINFKGGVGKTTLAFHLGTGLSWLHNSRVLLIDMDHQSSLSILCLRQAGWDKAVSDGRLVDEIFRYYVSPGRDMPGDDIIIESPMRRVDSDYDSMDIAPASLQLDNIEIELTASFSGGPTYSEWNKRTLMCRWIEETGVDERYDYIIFDCPPATKIVTQNAIAASQGYVIPVVPEAVMERGTRHLRDMIQSGIDGRLQYLSSQGDTRAMYAPDTRLVGLVVTRIQASRGHSGYTIDHTQHLASLEEYWKEALMKPYMLQGTGVSQALARSRPVYNYWWNQNVGKREIHIKYQELINEIKQRSDAL